MARLGRVLHSGRFFYRQCGEGLQANHAIQKSLMRIHMPLLRRFFSKGFRISAMGLLLLLASGAACLAEEKSKQMVAAPKKLEISRAARPWEFLSAVGKRAGLLGNESGRVEAWTYPLKILRDLRLTILTEGREIPAESLVRTVVVRPESTTLIYAGDTFKV